MRHILIAGLLFCAHPSAFSQEERKSIESEPTEEEAELDERIREAELNKRLLEKRVDVASKRIRVLHEIRELRRELERKVRLIEEGDDEDAEEFEEQVEKLEFQLELLEGRIELTHRRERLIDLRFDIELSRSRKFRWELDAMEVRLARGSRVLEKLIRAVAEGEEEEIEELEGELEELNETYDGRIELLGLKVELAQARREGEIEHIEELERELKELQEELGIEPDEDEGEEKRERPRKERKQAAMPSLEPTAADFAAVAGLDLNQHVAPLLTAACADCHSGDSSSGDLDIGKLLRVQPVGCESQALGQHHPATQSSVDAASGCRSAFRRRSQNDGCVADERD